MDELKKQLRSLTAARTTSNEVLKQIVVDQNKMVETSNRITEVWHQLTKEQNEIREKHVNAMDEIRQLNLKTMTELSAFIANQNEMLNASIGHRENAHLN